MGYRFDLTGQVFGRLTARKHVGNNAKKESLWLCRCACGVTITTTCSHLRSGNTKSCGCLQRDKAREIRTSHRHRGRKSTPTYNSWASMKTRCSPNQKKNTRNYQDYYLRGIRVCKRWARFENFLEDMGERPAGTSLDRINNNGNYEPTNCRWADAKTQRENNNATIYVSHKGRNQTVTAWSRELGISSFTVFSRIRRGVSPIQALGLAA